jgi:hypothetical protein
MSFGGRVGQFFFFIGLLLLVIFFASLLSGDPQFIACLSGGAVFALGVIAMWKGRNPEPLHDERFSILRRSRRKKSDK